MQKEVSPVISGAPTTAPVKARLKWFNSPKGFGFVNPVNREEVDAFLHITALQEIGIQAIGEGAVLLCHIEYGGKGAHVMKVIEVLDEGTLPAGIRAACPENGRELGQTQEMKGVVKWYKPEEGFGFVIPEDGQKDVFIHKTCLDRHGIDEIRAGQRLIMTFRKVPKGREVISFSFEKEPH